MKTIRNENIITFDVDDTLVMWGKSKHKRAKLITDPSSGLSYKLVPHRFHINLLIQHYGRGYTIIVWSAGGYAWAQEVVKELGIEKYVDLVMTKPCKYVDDLVCNEWMGEHLYFGDRFDEKED